MVRLSIHYLFSLAILILAGLLWVSLQAPAAVRVPVWFTSFNTPVFDATVGGETHSLLLDTGSVTPLTLSPEAFEAVRIGGVVETKKIGDMHGHIRDVDLFRIKKLRIEKFAWPKPQACVERHPPQYDGQIGLPWLRQYNVLLEFAKREMVLVHDPEVWEKEHLPKENMVVCPMVDSELILFDMDTELGRWRVMLDTGCTENLIRPDLLEDPKSSVSCSVAISGVDFGCYAWKSFDLPDYVEEFDGILGMEFIEKHRIYVDWTKQLIYFERS